MKYRIISRVSIADLPVIETQTINNLFKDNLRHSLGKKYSNVTSSIEVTEINDTDMLLVEVTCEARKDSEVIVRDLRRIVSSSINKLCEDELESVVFDITSLNVIKEI